MANSRLFQFRYSYERDIVEVMAKISIGATGAPTLTNAKGIASITRNSAGNFTIALKDNFYVLLGASVMFNTAGVGANTVAAAPIVQIITDSVNSASAPLVKILCASLAGTAADPANGEIMHIVLAMRNAST